MLKGKFCSAYRVEGESAVGRAAADENVKPSATVNVRRDDLMVVNYY